MSGNIRKFNNRIASTIQKLPWVKSVDVSWTQSLHSFRPEYLPDKHEYYVNLLFDQISSDEPPLNIALSGTYGSGKSSILIGFTARAKRRFRPLEISLTTLNQVEKPTRSEDSPETLTATLQKEIVKKIIYSSKPSRLPRSGFDRIKGIHHPSAIAVASVLAVGICGLLVTTNTGNTFPDWTHTWNSWKWLGYPLDFFSLSAFIYMLQLSFSRTKVREFGFGSAKLTLEEKGSDYFDKYLDEIMYFFQRTRTRVVILEDLDRFDDPGIFQELRELNNLLNSSDELKAPVTFVYALRDSLFEKVAGKPVTYAPNLSSSSENPSDIKNLPDESAGLVVDSAGSNRAKFFDLVIPVVPFISHEVSADLIHEAIKNIPLESQPSSRIISLAGRHITDMRVIYSVINEYIIFTAQLLKKSEITGLSEGRDQLFAMILYKHHYMLDYEKIRTGESKLDHLVRQISTLTGKRLAELDTEIAALKDAASTPAVVQRAEEAGQRLLEEMRYLLQFQYPTLEIDIHIVTLNIPSGGEEFSAEEVKGLKFWKRISSSEVTFLRIKNTHSPILIKSEIFPRLLRQDHPVSKWLHTATEKDKKTLATLEKIRSSLFGASIKQKVTDTDFISPVENGQTPKIDIPTEARRILQGGLAWELVQEGFIDQNFGLFTTQFYGTTISSAAKSYLIQYVDRQGNDPYFSLTPEDIEHIIKKNP